MRCARTRTLPLCARSRLPLVVSERARCARHAPPAQICSPHQRVPGLLHVRSRHYCKLLGALEFYITLRA